jgi:all-trans-retinol 13,14-reductase
MKKNVTWKPRFALEKPTASHRYDVIFIGTGIGALTAALEVAAKGAKVLMLEQHYLAGGVCGTYPRKGGFRFDAGVESISGLGERGALRHLLQKHGLDDKITWLRNTYEIVRGQERIVIPQDFFLWRDQLIARFLDEQMGIHDLFVELNAAYHEKNSVFGDDRLTPKAPTTIMEKMQFAMKNTHYVRWMTKTWQEMLQHFVKNEIIHEELSLLTSYVGDKKQATPADIMISLMGYYIEGGYRAKGGSGKLTAVLMDALRSYDVDIKLSTDVQKIIVKEGRVEGVITKKGEYYSDVVVSNADPRVTYEQLVAPEVIANDLRQKVETLRPSMSLFVWTVALDRPFITPNLLHVTLPEAMQLPLAKITIDRVGIQSAAALDPTLAPEGKGSVAMTIVTKANASWYRELDETSLRDVKDEIDQACRKILALIDQEGAKAILWSEVATPKTMEKFLRTYEGSVYSTMYDAAQSFPNYQTEIEGLYLVGAGTQIGPGIEAVVISGAQVAEKIAFTR